MQVMQPPVYDPVTDTIATSSLDYTLAGSHPAAIFTIADCPQCGLRYAIASQAGVVWYFGYENKCAIPPLAQGNDSEPACPTCTGTLEIFSPASVLSADGDWLHLTRGFAVG